MTDPALNSLYKKRGVNFGIWLDNLSLTISSCEKLWEIEVKPSFPELSYNFVAPVLGKDGEKSVLKLCPPEDHEFKTEVEALKLFGANGAVRLLNFDFALGAMLLEWLNPGEMLNSVDDDIKSTDIAIGVMRKLWCPAPAKHDFPTVSIWGEGFARLKQEFDHGTGPFPQDMVEKAEKIFSQFGNESANCLLHGDMHQGNILSSQRDRWLTIDPKGLVGPPEYDAATFLRSPLARIIQMENPLPFLQRRLDQMSQALCMDAKLLASWSFAQSVLSAWWSYEDNEEDWSTGLDGAKLFMKILNY